MKVEHIGIAVEELESSNRLFEKLLGFPPYKEESVDSEGVITSFFKLGDSKLELLQATHADSPIAKFLNKRKEGIHHVAFEVEDISSEIIRLEKEGFKLITPTPKRGADNKLVVFLHPGTTNGVLVELCQEIKETTENDKENRNQ
ncbi:methylmalonyl-CoA epimerase [Lunatibacter salilacus]|uniref:methylmalonyl-CoA epimerase n=1 Tax=Lunatibacter salilacus TaxID=2483804 RepID=UPI00131BF339|nr:methylmalonyl-CoA epimerase [Lunatibacter salilacus]